MARPLSPTPLVHHHAFYDIHHSIPLTRAQRDDLAAQITHLHDAHFTTPSLFVNIQFTHTIPETPFYVDGKPATLSAPSPFPIPPQSEFLFMASSVTIRVSTLALPPIPRRS